MILGRANHADIYRDEDPGKDEGTKGEKSFFKVVAYVDVKFFWEISSAQRNGIEHL